MIVPPPQIFSTSVEKCSLLVESTASLQTCRDVPNGLRSYTAVTERRLGERRRNADFRKGPRLLSALDRDTELSLRLAFLPLGISSGRLLHGGHPPLWRTMSLMIRMNRCLRLCLPSGAGREAGYVHLNCMGKDADLSVQSHCDPTTLWLS